MRSQSEPISLIDNGLAAEKVEELVRFARTLLGAHSDPEQLIRLLSSELSGFVVSDTVAVVLSKEVGLSGYVVDNGVLAIIPGSLSESWPDEICQVISEQPHPFVVSSLDQENRFNEAIRFFRERGNQ